MIPKQQIRFHNILFILLFLLQIKAVAQCPISYFNSNQGIINVVLGANCDASFDASPRVNVQGNCTLVYFRDAAMTIPFNGIPTFSGSNLGQTIEVFVSAEDGNTSTPLSTPLKFILKIIDSNSPIINCPVNQSFTTNGNLCNISVVNDLKATAIDNCNGTVNLTWSLSGSTILSGSNSLQGISINTGKTTAVYTATDASSNTSTCSFTIDVNETIAPSLLTCPSDVTLDATVGNCQRIVVAGLNPTYSDNCTLNNNLTLSYVFSGATEKNGLGSANNSLFNVGKTVVNFSAQDAFGNVNSACSFNVIIRDVDKPQVICPANLTINTFTDSCTALVSVSSLTPFRSDNCGQNDLNTSFSLSGATSQVLTNLQQVVNQRFIKGNTTVTYIVTDKAGNSSTCVQNVVVNDITKPKILCNSSHINTTTANGECNVQILLTQPTFSDNCSFANSLVLSYSLNGAVNASGNGFVPMTQQYVPGLTTVTYKATDESGNFAECSYNVTVIEVPLIKPTLVCRKDTTVFAENGKCNALIMNGLQPISASDNCTGLSLLKLRLNLSGATILADSLVAIDKGANGFSFNVGTTKVKYSLYDASGNVDSCTYNVIVKDLQRPVIQCVTDLSLNAETNCSQKAPNLQILATDNCSAAQLSFTYKLSGATTNPTQPTPINQVDFNIGVTTVKFYVKDASNNIDSCSFKISVFENIAPSIICPQNLTINTTDSTCTSVLNSMPLAQQLSDNCPTSSISWSFTSTGASSLQGNSESKNLVLNYGKSIFTYIAKDFSSNTAQCSFEIQVRDNTPPKINCPANFSVNAYDSTCYAKISSPALNFSDNCFASLSYTIKDVTGIDKSGNGIFANEILNIGKNIVTYKVTDNEANSSQCSFEISVLDITKPKITCPLNTKLLANNNCSAVLPTTSPISFSDNCSKQEISYSVSGATIYNEQNGVITAKSFNLGKSIATFKVTDIANNSATCSFEIEVIDKIKPVAKCKTDLTAALDNTGNIFVPAMMFDNGSSDNCSSSNLLTFSASKEYFNCSNLGLNTVFLTVKDASDNSSTCEAIINITNSFSNLNLNVAAAVQHESYWGAQDGRATISVSGGNGSFDFKWSNGYDEAIQNELSAGKYTITVTDKISGCSSVKEITIEQGPRLSINVGNIIGNEGETVLVPVRVQNFNKIKQLQFSLRLANISIGTIEGIQAIGVSQDSLKTSVIASSVNFSKTFLENDGKTLPNGSLLFNIRIKLTAKVGSYSNINFQTVQYTLSAFQYLPNGLINIPINAKSGLVAIGNGAATADIKGKIVREDKTPVNGVKISLSGSYVDSFKTNADGNYTFNLALGANVLMLASKKDEVRRGLTAIDALLLQRHILGYESFNSTYKKLAADVNKSGTLTALDVSEIKRVILGYQKEFRNVPIWQFVPSDVTFNATTQNQVPTYSDSLMIPYLLDNQANKDFIAIKTGDINLSASASTTRNIDNITFELEDFSANKGEEVIVKFKSNNNLNIGAIQFALQFDKNALAFEDIKTGVLNSFDASNYLENSNNIKLAWTSPQLQTVKNESSIFEIKFKALKEITSLKDKLWFNINDLEPIIYEAEKEKSLKIQFKSNDENKSIEYSFYPNPTQNLIYHNYPKGTTISIFDAFGKMQKKIEKTDSNYLEMSDLENGTYLMKVENNTFQKSEKIVILR